MSAELLDGEDSKGTSIGAEMSVRNVMTLTLMSAEERDPDERGADMVSLVLRPDEAGLELAGQIRDAMQTWIDHVRGN